MIRPVVVLLPLLVLVTSTPLHRTNHHHHLHHHHNAKHEPDTTETATKRQEAMEPWPKCCKLNGGNSRIGAQPCPGLGCNCGGGQPMGMDTNTEMGGMEQQEGASKRQQTSKPADQNASKRQAGMEPWPKCCNLNEGNSVGGAHGCQENVVAGGMNNGFTGSDPSQSTNSDTVDISPSEGQGQMEDQEVGEGQGGGEAEEGSKRSACEPWPKCCKLNGGKSGGGSKCPCNCGGSSMGDKNSFMDDKNSYMNDKNGYMDDKSSEMNGKMSYMDDKNSYMDGKDSYMNDKNSYMNDKNSYMDDKISDMNEKNSYMNDKNSYMDDKNSYMDDKNSYMNGKNSYMDDKNSYMDDKNSYMGDKSSDLYSKNALMDSKDTGSFKGTNNSLIETGDSKNSAMENSPAPSSFKPHDFDTHTVDKSCEGDYKECNQGWNACKTPCFGPQSFGGSVYGSSVKESDQRDMNTIKAIAAMDTKMASSGLRLTAGGSQEREPTSAEVQENDTKIAQVLSGRNSLSAGASAEGLMATGGQAVEPYKVKNPQVSQKETI